MNTAPGCSGRAEVEDKFNQHNVLLNDQNNRVEQSFGEDSEVYMVKKRVWTAADMDDFSGCLCIGCLELRLGRTLRPRDFTNHPFNSLPCTDRLAMRRRWLG
jgi:hypothetical protein